MSLLQEFPSKVTLCTVSVGYNAEKIYFMYHTGGGFSASCFYERFAKFIKRDQELLKIEALPWDKCDFGRKSMSKNRGDCAETK